jgi:hypothetical protein
MSPKEKAKELVEKYADSLPSVFYNVVESKNYHRAKQCALIAVDEILSILFQQYEIDYWKEVKKEIEKL